MATRRIFTPSPASLSPGAGKIERSTTREMSQANQPKHTKERQAPAPRRHRRDDSGIGLVEGDHHVDGSDRFDFPRTYHHEGFAPGPSIAEDVTQEGNLKTDLGHQGRLTETTTPYTLRSRISARVTDDVSKTTLTRASNAAQSSNHISELDSLPSSPTRHHRHDHPPRCVIRGSVRSFTHGVGVYNGVAGHGSFRAQAETERRPSRVPNTPPEEDRNELPVLSATSGPLYLPILLEELMSIGSRKKLGWGSDDLLDRESAMSPKNTGSQHLAQENARYGGREMTHPEEETRGQAVSEVLDVRKPISVLDRGRQVRLGIQSLPPPDVDVRHNEEHELITGDVARDSHPPINQKQYPIARGNRRTAEEHLVTVLKYPDTKPVEDKHKLSHLFHHHHDGHHHHTAKANREEETALCHQRSFLRKRRPSVSINTKHCNSLWKTRTTTDGHHICAGPGRVLHLLSPSKGKATEKRRATISGISNPIPTPISTGFGDFASGTPGQLDHESIPFENPRSAPSPPVGGKTAHPPLYFPAEELSADTYGSFFNVTKPRFGKKKKETTPADGVAPETSNRCCFPGNSSWDNVQHMALGRGIGDRPAPPNRKQASQERDSSSAMSATSSTGVVDVVLEDGREEDMLLSSVHRQSQIWHDHHPSTSQESVPSLTSFPHPPRKPIIDAGPVTTVLGPSPTQRGETTTKPTRSVPSPPRPSARSSSSTTCGSIPVDNPPARTEQAGGNDSLNNSAQKPPPGSGSSRSHHQRAKPTPGPQAIPGAEIGHAYRDYLPAAHRELLGIDWTHRERMEQRRRDKGREEEEEVKRQQQLEEKAPRWETPEGEQGVKKQRAKGKELILRGERVIYKCPTCGTETDLRAAVAEVGMGIGMAVGREEEEKGEVVEEGEWWTPMEELKG